MISEKGIEPNLDKIQALFLIKPPNSFKEVHKLTGCLAALNRFVSKSGERNLPFFKNLRRMSKENFTQDDENDKAFEKLKKYLQSPQLLSRPKPGEGLQLYLAISDVAVSSVLAHWPDKRKRKLKAYFESHHIQVIIDQPLKGVLSSPSLSGWLTTWAVEFSEFEISNIPRTSVKAQALADFVIEYTACPLPYNDKALAKRIS
ncbi:hypothetical protein LIER_16501 [Lithospermum erythrorhizon]|uniref:Reverse transcriptase/retrotransposon-derived protein RNase H-like domain-containing protein n=1 Tax=Lithospermum erythrorhizon TaxID=34254 RepID=A0AAV3Q6V6_LITER